MSGDNDLYGVFDEARGWLSADPEFVDDLNSNYEVLRTRHGTAAEAEHGETAEDYFARMQDAGLVLALGTGWHRDLRDVEAVKHAEAAGTVMLYGEDEDSGAALSAAVRKLPPHERLAAFRQRQNDYYREEA
jgi:hypothetical protein